MLQFRKIQMETFGEYMRQSFEDRMVKHIAEVFPTEYGAMVDPDTGDQPVRELVWDGVSKAEGYGITSERNVAMFIELMVEIAPDFDTRQDTAWTQELLRDEALPEDAKMDFIYEEFEAQEGPFEDDEL